MSVTVDEKLVLIKESSRKRKSKPCIESKENNVSTRLVINTVTDISQKVILATASVSQSKLLENNYLVKLIDKIKSATLTFNAKLKAIKKKTAENTDMFSLVTSY